METVPQIIKRAGLAGIIDTLPPFPNGEGDICPENPVYRSNYVYVYPKSLEELRILVGVPLEVANEHPENFTRTPQMEAARNIALNPSGQELDDSILKELAKELLLQPLPDLDSLRMNSGYQQAIQYMLNRAKVLPVLAGDNLVIKDGETKVITRTAKAVFKRITIYGSGCMELGCDMRVEAEIIEHI